MRELPSGTVTLLFTDMEGSTRLLAEHGHAYAELLAEHRRILREGFAAHGGVEVDTQGDAFFVAFARVSDALEAARAGQESLAETPIRVRMGLHTGEPELGEEGYVGMDVHRAARVAAAAHGGQVLLSEQTSRLLDGVPLRDLGVHRLKDVGETRIYQLGLADFPPLKTLHQLHLPTPANALIGRKKELIDVVRMLTRERARVVTLTGPGGTGKTRFSVAAAEESAGSFPDGVWFADLSPVREPALVLHAVGTALGAQVPLAEHVGDRELLVVLDNLEQVVDAAPDIAALVASCAGLQLLCTSREPLRIGPEREYPLKPLPESPAIELFRQRAGAALPGTEVEYDVAAAICERLDRLPLAIELAAARVKVFDPQALLERLERRLPLLASRSRDLPARQRTLRDTIGWSYELLPPVEQELFRRLAVFAGGATLEAIEGVCGGDPDLVEALLDKSLLRRWGAGRLGMLETIREYALERLDDSEEAENIREQHARFYLEVANMGGLAADWDGPQRHDLVLPEVGNLRSAIDWCTGRGQVELGLSLAVALENFWATTDPDEGARRFEALLAQAQNLPKALRARALRGYASCTGPLVATDDRQLIRRLLSESLDLYRELQDERGAAIILHRLAVLASWDGDSPRARTFAEESLAGHRNVGFAKGELQALSLLGHLEWGEGRKEHAVELKQASVRLAHEVGFRWWEVNELLELGTWALESGRSAETDSLARESLAISRTIAYRAGSFWALVLLAAGAAVDRRWAQAGRLWGAAEAEAERAPIPAWLGEQALAAYILNDSGPAFAQEYEAGRSLPFESAIDEALRPPRSETSAP